MTAQVGGGRLPGREVTDWDDLDWDLGEVDGSWWMRRCLDVDGSW